jgi:glucokinase
VSSLEPHVVGVDVGGTDTKAALVDAGGTARAARSLPTPHAGAATADRVIDLVADLVEELGRESRPAAVGLAVPGLVDEAGGRAVWSENIDWRDVPFVAAVGERCGLPAVLGHDVRAGGLAESRLGAARGVDDVLFMPIGTGIAAAVILGGRLHAGDGYAGEIGHVDVGHGEPCACGGSGCLEAIASAAAIARRYAARTGRPDGGARDVVRSARSGRSQPDAVVGPSVAGAEEVVRAARAGDPDAIAVWEEALDALGLALAWAASVLAPQVIVIGGGLSRAGDALLDPLAERMARRLTFQRVPRLVPAALGDRAGCLGAALLALDGVRAC